jgi:glycerol-3-phosphate O-acyltransferase
MDGLTLKERYGHMFAELAKLTNTSNIIDETNVFQEANPALRKVMWDMLSEEILPSSCLEGRENFEELYKRLKEGKRCLIVPEHYSNLDLPALCYLLDKDASDFGKEFAEKSVSIAGMKLTEVNSAIKAWTEGFSHINIYPSRSLAAIKDPEILERETMRSKKINMASMRALDTVRRSGRPVIVFPSGTRYRPGKPETKRALREIDSYLRIFDYMVLVSINGSCLRINPDRAEDMLADTVHRDTMIIAASPVMDCKQFRSSIIDPLKDKSEVDGRQAVADRITELLEIQHEKYEKLRQVEA